MTTEDAQEFALKFMRKPRPDPQTCMQCWAISWRLSIFNFKSSKADFGFHFNYVIAFSVIVPKSRLKFLLDDLRSTVYSRLDAAWVKSRAYDHKEAAVVYIDAQIPNVDEYNHSLR